MFRLAHQQWKHGWARYLGEEVVVVSIALAQGEQHQESEAVVGYFFCFVAKVSPAKPETSHLPYKSYVCHSKNEATLVEKAMP